MKSFVGGIVGAVVSGLLLFFAQNWWSQNDTGSKQRISFDKISDFSISRDELTQLAKKGSDFQNPTIHVFEARNTGTADIADKAFSSANSDILGFNSISFPNRNPKNAVISYDGKVITVKYRLLPAGSKHSFWISSNSIIFPEFSNDNTGIHVATSMEKIQADLEPFPWIWFGAIGACFISILIGAVINESYISQRLNKRGHDLKSLMGFEPSSPPNP